MYGIFLDEYTRQAYGMSNAKYATVRDYATVGLGIDGIIVEAIPVREGGFCLTGLVVDVRPDMWFSLDALEGGYQRIKVRTTENEEVFMYTAK